MQFLQINFPTIFFFHFVPLLFYCPLIYFLVQLCHDGRISLGTCEIKMTTKFCFRIFCQKVIGEKKPIPFLKFQYVLISKLSPTNCLELCKSHQFSVLQMTWKIIFWYEKVLIDCPCLWGYHIRHDQGHVGCKFQLLIISHWYPYLLATWKTSSVKG